MIEEMFEWTCPRQECKKRITSFTENGMKAFRDRHISQHMREDRETEIAKIDDRKQLPEAKPEPEPIVIKPRDYNVLKLTIVDMGFLKTRGIARDENIVLDYGDDDVTE